MAEAPLDAPALAALAQRVRAGQRLTERHLIAAQLLGPGRRPQSEVDAAIALVAASQVPRDVNERVRAAPPPFVFADDGALWRRRLEPEECGCAIIDVNNVVWTLGHAADGVARVVQALRIAGVPRIEAFADAPIPHEIGAEAVAILADLCDAWTVSAPGTRADDAILARAAEVASFVVTNDQYRGYRRRPAWRRRIGVAPDERWIPAWFGRELATCGDWPSRVDL